MPMYDSNWISSVTTMVENSTFSNKTKGFLKYFLSHCSYTNRKVYKETETYIAYYIAGTITMRNGMWDSVRKELDKYIIYEANVNDGIRYTLGLSKLLGDLSEKGTLICATQFKTEQEEISSDDTAAERGTPRYKEWVDQVMFRDNHMCQCCGSRLNLEVHHIIPYAKDKSKRTDIHNGITLCENCHSAMILGGFHQIYGKRNTNIDQLQEYFNNKRRLLHLPMINVADIIK